MLAVISDIHSNLEALTAVLEEIDRRGIRRIVCLGDVVGYGPNPAECLDLVRERCEVALCGNHDYAVFYEPSNFNVGAERACYWTRQVLESVGNRAARKARWEFLGRMPSRWETDGFLLVHGSPRRPINEYLFPEDVYTNPQKIVVNFERFAHRVCFVGHTHVPGVFTDEPYFEQPDDFDEPNRFLLLPEERVIVNVGSVGQPRDRDARACFVIVSNGQSGQDGDAQVTRNPQHDSGEASTATSPTGAQPEASVLTAADLASAETLHFEFVRVEYDIEQTIRKIQQIPELDDFLGERLLDGR